MKGLGTVLAIIGILIIIVAAINHFASHTLNFGHATTYVGIVGVVVLVIGALIFMMGGRKAA